MLLTEDGNSTNDALNGDALIDELPFNSDIQCEHGKRKWMRDGISQAPCCAITCNLTPTASKTNLHKISDITPFLYDVFISIGVLGQANTVLTR